MGRLSPLPAAAVVGAVLVVGACLTKDNPLHGAVSEASESTTASSGDTSTATTMTTVGSEASTTSSTVTSSSSTERGVGSTGGTVELGPWQMPTKVDELDIDGVPEDDPTLTSDLLEIYIAVDADAGPEEIYRSTRGDIGDVWATPTPVVELVEMGMDSGTPEVSPDGLILLFHRSPEGSFEDQIYISQRNGRGDMWGTPVEISELNSAGVDISATPSWDLTRVVLCSDRADGGAVGRNIWEAEVDFDTPNYGEPMLLMGLATDDDNCTAHLSPDGLTIYFDSNRPGTSGPFDIWTATRPDLDSAFENPAPVEGQINTPIGDLDPWVSEDGRTMYFTRGDAPDAIYRSTRDPL